MDLIEINEKHVDVILALDAKSKWVAPNSLSLEQYELCDKSKTHAFGISVEDKMIGFAMIDTVLGYLKITRFMIDHKFQNRGFGTIAIKLVMDKAFELFPEFSLMHICTGNPIAKHLYEKVGFVDTKKIEKIHTPFGIIEQNCFIYSK